MRWLRSNRATNLRSESSNRKELSSAYERTLRASNSKDFKKAFEYFKTLQEKGEEVAEQFRLNKDGVNDSLEKFQNTFLDKWKETHPQDAQKSPGELWKDIADKIPTPKTKSGKPSNEGIPSKEERMKQEREREKLKEQRDIKKIEQEKRKLRITTQR